MHHGPVWSCLILLFSGVLLCLLHVPSSVRLPSLFFSLHTFQSHLPCISLVSPALLEVVLPTNQLLLSVMSFSHGSFSSCMYSSANAWLHSASVNWNKDFWLWSCLTPPALLLVCDNFLTILSSFLSLQFYLVAGYGHTDFWVWWNGVRAEGMYQRGTNLNMRKPQKMKILESVIKHTLASVWINLSWTVNLQKGSVAGSRG